MIMRFLLLLTVCLLLNVAVLGQQTPPAPSTPPAPQPPIKPEDPGAFSIFIDGSNFLGVTTEEVTKENMSRYGLQREPRGVVVTKVAEGSPAERAGLKKDDVILRFDDEAVTSNRKLRRLVSEAAPEQSVKLTISRAGAEQAVTVALGKRETGASFQISNNANFPQRAELSRGVDQAGRLAEKSLKLLERDRGRGAFMMDFGSRRRIGVTTVPMTEQLADHLGVKEKRGVLITSVVENSPAAKAGLRAGDVITEVNNDKVAASGDLVRALGKGESEATLSIVRDKAERTIKLVPERTATPHFDFVPEVQVTPPFTQ